MIDDAPTAAEISRVMAAMAHRGHRLREKVCERCHDNYDATSGWQKYCPACKPLARNERRRRKD